MPKPMGVRFIGGPADGEYRQVPEHSPAIQVPVLGKIPLEIKEEAEVTIFNYTVIQLCNGVHIAIDENWSLADAMKHLVTHYQVPDENA